MWAGCCRALALRTRWLPVDRGMTLEALHSSVDAMKSGRRVSQPFATRWRRVNIGPILVGVAER